MKGKRWVDIKSYMDRVEEVLGEGTLGRRDNITAYFTERMNHSFGICRTTFVRSRPTTSVISLSLPWLRAIKGLAGPEVAKAELEQTIYHELCHVYEQHQGSTNHSAHWRYAMRRLGLPADILHFATGDTCVPGTKVTWRQVWAQKESASKG